MKITALLLLAAAVTVTGYAQTPSAPPRAQRGHSIVTRSMARRGYLGVGIVELTSERAKALKLADDSGIEVKRVDENSPASKAGLRENDVILEVNGQKVDDIERFISSIGDTSPGSKVNLTIWRAGAKQNVTATVESRPQQYFVFNEDDGDLIAPMPPMPPMTPFSVLTGQTPRLGIEGETLTPQLAAYFGVKEGVLVRTVSERTAADKAGLKAGDVITKVSGTPVSSPREISGLIRAGHKTATFTVMRNHKEITLNVEISEDRFPASEREVL